MSINAWPLPEPVVVEVLLVPVVVEVFPVPKLIILETLALLADLTNSHFNAVELTRKDLSSAIKAVAVAAVEQKLSILTNNSAVIMFFSRVLEMSVKKLDFLYF